MDMWLPIADWIGGKTALCWNGIGNASVPWAALHFPARLDLRSATWNLNMWTADHAGVGAGVSLTVLLRLLRRLFPQEITNAGHAPVYSTQAVVSIALIFVGQFWKLRARTAPATPIKAIAGLALLE